MRCNKIQINTNGQGFYSIQEKIEDFLKTQNKKDGLLNIFIRHTSASLTVTENYDPDVKKDLLDFYDNLAPQQKTYKHSLEGFDDMPAHIKNSLLGVSLSIPFENGKLLLGKWQKVYLFEHKISPQTREIVLTILG